MVAIDFYTADAKQTARARYDERQRNEQKHPRRTRKSTNRAIGLDNRSSANGVNSSRARRVVETVGTAALEWTADDYSFSVSEEMLALVNREAGYAHEQARDGQDAPALGAGAYRIRLGGEIYRVSISEPYQMERRRWVIVTFEDMNCNVRFPVTLAQLVKVIDIAPVLAIVQKPVAPVWMPSEAALRWTAAMCAVAGYCAYHMAYDLTDALCIPDTSGLFRVSADGYVIEI